MTGKIKCSVLLMECSHFLIKREGVLKISMLSTLETLQQQIAVCTSLKMKIFLFLTIQKISMDSTEYKCMLFDLNSVLLHPARCSAAHELAHQFDEFHITFKSNSIVEVYLYKRLFFILKLRVIYNCKKEPNLFLNCSCLIVL